ncbi:MAG TPA: cysteine--tRNA ligase [Candidatus Dormibacteraeota bacterium]|nr:cysteine--tRNA ligase [Candidatus Dormibacteraeota bacterium]
MTPLRLHNTMSGQVQEFVSIDAGHVRMYTCGPTVHDFAHIGNFRTFLFEDLLRRVLAENGYRVTQVMNLTDVEDRIIKKAADKGIPIDEFTEPFIEAFFEDLRTLRIEKAEVYPRATRHLFEMVSLIEILNEKGHTYVSDGSTYFRIATFPRYGALSHLDPAALMPGVRVDVDDYGKDDPRDFALWKARKPGEQSWETPLGAGRPGWHIECSAMSMKYLGESFDIHTGGVDNIFPHHENEIAQSEAATGKQFVRFWLHAQHLQDAMGEKMSKRLKNFSTLRDLLQEGFQPRVIRYALLTGAHYRSPLAFSPDLLKAAEGAIRRLDEFAVRLGPETPSMPEAPSPLRIGQGGGAEAARERWDDALRDDLNLPAAVGFLFDFIKEFNPKLDAGQPTPEERAAAMALLRHANRILDVVEFPQAVDAEVERLIAERQVARERRDFARSDAIRQELLGMGIQLDDTKEGTRWKRVR